MRRALDNRVSAGQNAAVEHMPELIDTFEANALEAAAEVRRIQCTRDAIRQEIERATRRKCSIGALYTTLDRLEQKGLIETWMGASTPERGGRPKRMVRLTAKGSREATAFYRTVVRASDGLSWQTD